MKSEQTLKVYTIGDTTILGIKEKRTISGMVILGDDPIDRQTFIKYVKNDLACTTNKIKVGKGKDMLTFDLTDTQMLDYQRVVDEFSIAAERAQGLLINWSFDSLFNGGSVK